MFTFSQKSQFVIYYDIYNTANIVNFIKLLKTFFFHIYLTIWNPYWAQKNSYWYRQAFAESWGTFTYTII